MFRYTLKLLFLSAISFNSGIEFNSIALSANNPETKVFEITDRDNLVEFVLTSNTVYMLLSEEVRVLTNLERNSKMNTLFHDFRDSEGNFIIQENSELTTNKIEFRIDQINSMRFEKGKLLISYTTPPAFPFEEVYSGDQKVLDRFYIEDLEALSLHFNKIKNSKL
jgi:hypothetical protein